MKDLKTLPLLTLAATLMLSATSLIAMEETGAGDPALGGSYVPPSSQLLLTQSAAAKPPAGDDDGMGEPVKSHVAGAEEGDGTVDALQQQLSSARLGDADEHAAATVRAFKASGNPDLFVGEWNAYFAGLSVDTTVGHALNGFRDLTYALYVATGADDPTCRNGMDANVTELYKHLAAEGDVAAALHHIEGLTTQHQALLDALKKPDSAAAAASPTTQQPVGAFPAGDDGDAPTNDEESLF